MALAIKDPEAYGLASELAELTSISITAVVIEALRQQAPTEQQHLAEALMLIGQRCAPYLQPPVKSTEHGDLLYNEMGLPG